MTTPTNQAQHDAIDEAFARRLEALTQAKPKHPTFDWEGVASKVAPMLPKASGKAAPPKNHPMRNGTSSINTEPVKLVRVKGAAI